MKTKYILLLIAMMTAIGTTAQTWPSPKPEARPGTRWWWLGSAVDHQGLEWNLGEYARVGIGAVEITPLYGVKGNEAHELPFLSPQWMAALRDVQQIAAAHHIEVDMNCGTGWPFGGPEVTIDEAACKAVFVDSMITSDKRPSDQHRLAVPAKERPYAQWQCTRVYPTSQPRQWRVISVYASRTRQKVKRAAPGGEGLVIDHFDRQAVAHYLNRFTQAFEYTKTPYPHTFFNDSYEVYKANWTPSLFDEFLKRRGYDLRDHLPELLDGGDGNKALHDYRETLSDLLYENFTQQWVAWAHRNGVSVRNQAHGSPANLLDLYAAVDIPEIEGFGRSEFGIRGLRRDPGMTLKNYSDVSMLKYASSAAHVMGKPLTSSETLTWLTEHFRTSLSQMKPDIDLMFSCGINHIFFHGSCYTPEHDPWPGWKFYASVDMSPTNSIWRDAPFLMQYIERCQSFLQMGQPDNDFLVYLPVHDMWRIRGPRNDDAKSESKDRRGGEDLLMQFDIHTMDEKCPQFIRSILRIDSLGYDCDYISDRQLAQVKVDGGQLVTPGGTRYRGIIIPTGTTVDDRLQSLLQNLTPYIIYGEDRQAMAHLAKPEPWRMNPGVRMIRRKTDDGYIYFVVNLSPRDCCLNAACLSVPTQHIVCYNPMTGDVNRLPMVADAPVVCLQSGESIILQTGTAADRPLSTGQYGMTLETETLPLDGPWTLSFIDETPRVSETYTMPTPQTWETLGESASVTMGTGVYETAFRLTRKQATQACIISLGKVYESARVYINGKFIGCAWAAPFQLDCRDALRKGKNTLRIEVTNLPANRIRDLDRRGVEWRKFKEINFVDINYKKTRYDGWQLMRSGLQGAPLLHFYPQTPSAWPSVGATNNKKLNYRMWEVKGS